MRLLAMAVILAAPVAVHAEAASTHRTDAPEKSADSPDKIICKRFPVTGSLVATYKTCKTKLEWERERDNIRQLDVANACRNWANQGGC